jgi:predicted AlkP superfamily phosphohydrolase/phosphomutase/tetratricopeptide (TPR) repeat protein
MAVRKVLLVGWDAADWKVIRPLMEAGKMPHVRHLVENGVAGQIATLRPPLSPMLWTSIATGKRPFKHGIHGFSEPAPGGRGVQPVTNLSRKSKALWNILNQNDLRSVVIGWWPSHPAEPIDGVMVSDRFHRAGGPLDEGWPPVAHAVHPPDLAGILADLRMHPDIVTQEMVEEFIPLAREIDQDKDKRLGLLMRTIAECMSIHSAAIWLLNNRPWDFFTVYYDAIDHFCHGFMRYHPPRQSWIPECDFELYNGVVSTAYRFHDRLLGDLLKKAGDDTVIILMSDHGFHPDHLRPASIPDVPAGPSIEHRDFGILAMSGPDIRKGEVLHGASVLDVASTILTLYGLPAGEDFDGKVLSQAFVKAPQISFIRSWEEVPGADGRHPPHTRLDAAAAHEALEQMIALGYIARPDENREVAVTRTLRELRYNLGLAYQDAARHIEAHEIFTGLHAADPDEQRFAVGLFVSCQALGLIEEMRRIIDHLGGRGRPAVVDYLNAQVLTAERRYDEALTALERIRPRLHLQTGDLYLRLGRPRKAEQVFEEALTIDPDNTYAHLGLCRVALRRRKFGVAAQAALNALEHVYQDPQAHFLLGLALEGLKDYARAAEAFRAAISFNPNFAEAHARLAILLGKHLGDTESAREHRVLARRMRNRGATCSTRPPGDEAIHAVSGSSELPVARDRAEIPPVAECLIVVTGLPRAGTSMLLQMLAAGGIDVLSDGLRKADEDNPRGYLEYEPVRNLATKNQANDSKWLFEARGRAVKIVVPLLDALPPDLTCRVILAERDLEEVLDSQELMLVRRNHRLAASPERRQMLRDEYSRMLGRARAMLTSRPGTQWLAIDHRIAISSPHLAAEKINKFLGGGLDVAAMSAAIDPTLHRNRADVSL